MNKTAQQSGRQTLSGIKSLRACDTASKPLHVTVLQAIEETFACIGRIAYCKSQYNKPFALKTQSNSSAAERFVVNDFGKWTAAN